MSDLQALAVDDIARVCHEANRALQAAQMEYKDTGIPVAPIWEDLEPEVKDGIRNGVQHALDGATPELLHELWCREKRVAGWRYGEVKDKDLGLHPCLVDWDQLPAEQRAKDRLFHNVIAALTAD